MQIFICRLKFVRDLVDTLNLLLNLVIRRRSRIADLSLNGKFFKRYDLRGAIKAKEGAYEVPERRKALWNILGPAFSRDDRAELELLIPSGSSVLISEL